MRLLWWLGTVFGISIISIFLSHNHALDPIENLSLTVTSPAQSALRDGARPVNNIFAGITDRGDLVRENERLREENELLRAQLAEQEDLGQRIEALEEALEIKQSRPEDLLLAANVVAQDPSGLRHLIAIDRGSADGLDEGMSVLSENGSLVGTISRVYQDFAWIRLVTDPDSVINAQVNLLTDLPGGEPPQVITPDAPSPTPSPDVSQDPEPTPEPQAFTRGVAEGDLRNGIVLDLPSDVEVREGSLVVTSGLGGNYPRALLIGTIRSVDSRPQSPFTRTVLDPSAELSTLDTVLVLVSFKPARLEGP